MKLYIFVLSIFVGLSLLMLKPAIESYKSTMLKVHSESKCISKLVSEGVERKDIATVDGQCSVANNAYYLN